MGYEVRETSPDLLTIVGTTTKTSFLWSGLKPDTNYCVYVYTLDSSGTNATSSTCFTTLLPQGTLTLKSVNWNNFGNNMPNFFENPRVNFGGEDSLPYNDDVTATEWCKHVPGASYTSGTSHTNFANPQDGIHYSFDGTKWISHNGGDYPRWYDCSTASVGTTSPITTTPILPAPTSGPVLFATSTTNASTIYVWDGGTEPVAPQEIVPVGSPGVIFSPIPVDTTTTTPTWTPAIKKVFIPANLDSSSLPGGGSNSGSGGSSAVPPDSTSFHSSASSSLIEI